VGKSIRVEEGRRRVLRKSRGGGGNGEHGGGVPGRGKLGSAWEGKGE